MAGVGQTTASKASDQAATLGTNVGRTTTTAGNTIAQTQIAAGEAKAGGAINQSYTSPLLPVSKSKTDILNLREGIVELGQPQGAIDFSLLGVRKRQCLYNPCHGNHH